MRKFRIPLAALAAAMGPSVVSLFGTLLAITPSSAADGRQWKLKLEPDYARLAYDGGDQDGVISFSCTPGEGSVAVFVAVPDETKNAARVPIVLAAGGKEIRTRGEVENSVAETAMADTKLAASHPMLLALSSEGVLRASAGGAKHEIAITSAAANQAKQLLDACSKKPGRR